MEGDGDEPGPASPSVWSPPAHAPPFQVSTWCQKLPPDLGDAKEGGLPAEGGAPACALPGGTQQEGQQAHHLDGGLCATQWQPPLGPEAMEPELQGRAFRTVTLSLWPLHSRTGQDLELWGRQQAQPGGHSAALGPTARLSRLTWTPLPTLSDRICLLDRTRQAHTRCVQGTKPPPGPEHPSNAGSESASASGGRSRVPALVHPPSLRRGFGADRWVSSLGSWGAGASLGRAPTSTSAPLSAESKGPRASPGD